MVLDSVSVRRRVWSMQCQVCVRNIIIIIHSQPRDSFLAATNDTNDGGRDEPPFCPPSLAVSRQVATFPCLFLQDTYSIVTNQQQVGPSKSQTTANNTRFFLPSHAGTEKVDGVGHLFFRWSFFLPKRAVDGRRWTAVHVRASRGHVRSTHNLLVVHHRAASVGSG